MGGKDAGPATEIKEGLGKGKDYEVLGASKITAYLYCNCVQFYWEGCVICSIYLR